MAFCTNCGKELGEGTKFCANCGAPVSAPQMRPEVIQNSESVIADDNSEKTDFNSEKINIIDADTSAKSDNIPNAMKQSDSKGSQKKNKKDKEKHGFPVRGIIALVFALIGFFGDQSALTVIVSIAALVLAVLSLIKKEKKKGLAIAALVIAILSIGATAGNHYNAQNKSEKTTDASSTSESSDSQKSDVVSETKAEEDEADTEEKKIEFSIDGITFEIPGKYEEGDNGSFTCQNGNAGIFFVDSGAGTTDETFTAISDKIDSTMDEMVENTLSDGVRKSAVDSETAGFKSRTYCYSANIDGIDATAYLVVINNIKNNRLLMVLAASTDELKEETEADFNEILDTAKYTNAENTQKASETTESAAEKETEAEENPSLIETGGVDPDLKAFLDEYEDFVDEYVDFMQKYSKNPSDLSLLADYADIMQEYTEFAEKLDKYDSSTMSTADSAYYLEVTTRCAEKMLKVADSMGN